MSTSELLTAISVGAGVVWWASAIFVKVSDMAKSLHEMKEWLVSLNEKNHDHEVRISVLENKKQ